MADQIVQPIVPPFMQVGQMAQGFVPVDPMAQGFMQAGPIGVGQPFMQAGRVGHHPAAPFCPGFFAKSGDRPAGVAAGSRA